MRKIEKEMVEALLSGNDWMKDNTAVIFSDHNGNPYCAAHVELYGHTIAELSTDGTLCMDEVTLHKWPTVTTRNRLNALGFSVRQYKGEQYIDTDTITLKRCRDHLAIYI